MECKKAPNTSKREKFIANNRLAMRKKEKLAMNLTQGNIDFPTMDPYDQNKLFSSPIASQTISNDSEMSPAQRAYALQLVNDAAKEKGGLFTTQDIVRAGVGAGLGYAAASATGGVMGNIFGLPPKAQKVLSGVGALGGFLRATGFWK